MTEDQVARNLPLHICVQGGVLSITVGVDTLAFAAENGKDWNPYDQIRGGSSFRSGR